MSDSSNDVVSPVPESKPVPWYLDWIFIIAMLVFCPLLGFVLLWVSPRPKGSLQKWAITLAVVTAWIAIQGLYWVIFMYPGYHTLGVF